MDTADMMWAKNQAAITQRRAKGSVAIDSQGSWYSPAASVGATPPWSGCEGYWNPCVRDSASTPLGSPGTTSYKLADYLADAVIIDAVAKEARFSHSPTLHVPLNVAQMALGVCQTILDTDRERLALVAWSEATTSLSPLNDCCRLNNVIERFQRGPDQDLHTLDGFPSQYQGNFARGRENSLSDERTILDMYSLVLDTKKVGVPFFLTLVETLEKAYSREAILRKLIRDVLSKPATDGCRWFLALPSETRAALALSLTLWKVLLQRDFLNGPATLRKEADALTHRFENEAHLDLWAYIDKKLELYYHSGCEVEHEIALGLLSGADPFLVQAISLAESKPTVPEIVKALTVNAFSGRRAWLYSQADACFSKSIRVC